MNKNERMAEVLGQTDANQLSQGMVQTVGCVYNSKKLLKKNVLIRTVVEEH